MGLEILFLILAGLAIATAIITIASKHPIRSAMALVVHFFMLAGLYFTLNAQFIAAIQVLVYAGAIMVLVIFVIMLLNLGDEESFMMKLKTRQVIGILVGAALAVLLIATLAVTQSGHQFNPELAAEIGSAQNLGNELFTNYLFPFEAISILLIVAIVGAIVLAKRNLD